MANELADEKFAELLAEAKLTEEKFAELLAEATKETAERGNITVATEEEVSALTDIMAMKEEEARRYNQMGKELEEKDLYDNAVKWYIKAAELALNIAPRSGVVVKSLHSVAHNKIYQYEQMREGFSLSSAPGADAQVNLGCFYHFGTAVPQDYTKALEWFTKAAAQGHAGAQYLTANALYNNRGAPPNMTAKDRQAQALYWYKKSAEGGDEGAKEELKRIESEMRSEE